MRGLGSGAFSRIVCAPGDRSPPTRVPLLFHPTHILSNWGINLFVSHKHWRRPPVWTALLKTGEFFLRLPWASGSTCEFRGWSECLSVEEGLIPWSWLQPGPCGVFCLLPACLQGDAWAGKALRVVSVLCRALWVDPLGCSACPGHAVCGKLRWRWQSAVLATPA